MIEISVVSPVYHSESCLPALYQRLTACLEKMKVSYEIIFIEDGGTDGSWRLLEALAKKDPRVKAYQLSRNFGQHAAITAGLTQSSGNWAVVMDSDLQDPPEEIPRLYAKAKEGFDIVYTLREKRKHSIFKQLASGIFYQALRVFTKSDIDSRMGGFSIISGRVIDAFLDVRDMNRHYLLILHWLGFRSTAIEYVHSKRLSGETTYNLGKLLHHALMGMFFQTTVLLNWIVYAGFIFSFVGLTGAAYSVYVYFQHSVYPGWTSLFVLILVTTGFLLVSLGITGLYIGRVFEQVKDRPVFVIRRKVENQAVG